MKIVGSCIKCFGLPACRFVSVLSVAIVLAGCQTSFKVEPALTDQDEAQTANGSSSIEIVGAEKFDKKIFPVTFACSVADFNITYSENAKQSIMLAARKLPAFQQGKVTVSEVMIRVMNLLNRQYDHRFDVEVRIGLTAELRDNAGKTKTINVSEQILNVGESADGITCAPAKEALEDALPKALDKTLLKLIASATKVS